MKKVAVERVLAILAVVLTYMVTAGIRFDSSSFLELSVPLIALFAGIWTKQKLAISFGTSAATLVFVLVVASGAPDRSIQDAIFPIIMTVLWCFLTSLLIGVAIHGIGNQRNRA